MARLLRPKERLNIWQWADRYRFLGKGVSAKSEHGRARYNSADAPHQREVQESFTDPEVRLTVVVGASQLFGKTEIINNVSLYHIEHVPRSQVIMYATIETAEKFSKNKLTPAIENTEVVSALVSQHKTRSSASTILQKQFVGGSIYIVGSNSTSSLRGASGPILLGDEVDDYESDIGGQGDPVQLLWKRGESFSVTSRGLFSTPTVEGHSRIWKNLEDSDFRLWFMPCARCGKEIIFKWSNESKLDAELPSAVMEWTKGNTRTAHLVCQCCGNDINDAQRRDMYFAGKWKGTRPFAGIRGYHMNWMYSPWKQHKGFDHRLHEMAEEWELAAKKGSNELKVLINTGLCECFAEKYEKPPDDNELLMRCEPYQTWIPEPVVYLTCFVDVQNDRLELEILGWGVGEESWGIEVKKIFGNPFQTDVWNQLDAVLNQTFDHPCGAKLKISCALVDSGGVSDSRAFAKPVYAFVRRRQGRHVFASKGSSVLGSPIVVGHLQKNGIMLQSIGTDVCKSTVYDRLKIVEPGPQYCHFPQGRGYDAEYFKQLTAERVLIANQKRQWVKSRQRNEGLDMRAGNLAAFEIRNPNLEAIAENLRKAGESVKHPKPPEPEPKPPGVLSVIPQNPKPRPNPMRRRIGFTKWQ